MLKMLTAFGVVFVMALLARNESTAIEEKSCVPGELIVEVKDALPELSENFGINRAERIRRNRNGKSNIYVLHFDPSEDVAAKAEELLASGEVASLFLNSTHS